MRINDEFQKVFEQYKKLAGNQNVNYVVTSTNRQGDPKKNPHAIKDNAMDITLRTRGQYSPISEYNELMAFLIEKWPYRAGVDNTTGNIHIHLDLGMLLPKGQKMPYFFLEDGGVWIREVKSKEDL